MDNLSAQDIATIRQEVLNLQKTKGLKNANVSRLAGVPQSTLSQFMSDTYPGDVQKVAIKLRNWLVAYGERVSIRSKIGRGSEFVETDTAKKVMLVLKYCHATGDMGAIVGAPGLGKTETAKEFSQKNPLTWHLECAPTISSPTGLLRKIATTMNLTNSSQSDAIRRQIEQKFSSSAMLIIDEAQHLSLNALEELRSIHDTVGMAVVLMGNEKVIGRISGGGRDAMFAQLNSRLGMRLTVPSRPTEDDIHAIVSAFQIEEKSDKDYLTKIGRSHGALRSVVKVIKLARMIQPAADQEDIGLLPYLKSAAQQLNAAGV